MERIAIDVLRLLPGSEHDNKYFLMAIDYFTKWQEAFTLPNQEAVTVVKVWVDEFLYHFGIPLKFHSDQRKNFKSRIFQKVCKLLQIKKTRTTPLHPQSNGMVQWLNHTIEAQQCL